MELTIITKSEVTKNETGNYTLTIYVIPEIQKEQGKLYADFKSSLEKKWQAEELKDKTLFQILKSEVKTKEQRMSQHRIANMQIFKKEEKFLKERYEFEQVIYINQINIRNYF
jgi:hypothetical protein